MKQTSLIALAAIVALNGCKAKEAIDSAAVSRDLDKRGTVQLLKETADDEYTAPADGRLTDAQIQMYLKVREHEKKVLAVAKAEMQQHAKAAEKAGEQSLAGMMEAFKTIGSAADVATADIRAAKDLRFNTQEYLWVKQQILAVSAAAMAQKAGQAIQSGLDSTYAQIRKAHDEAKDEPTRKMYADMLAGYEKAKAETVQSAGTDPSLAYNQQLLSKYESAMTALATELSKWEGKPGDAQNMVSEMERATARQAEATQPKQ